MIPVGARGKDSVAGRCEGKVRPSCSVYRVVAGLPLQCRNAMFSSLQACLSPERPSLGQRTPVSADSLPFSLATPAAGYLLRSVERLPYVNIPPGLKQ